MSHPRLLRLFFDYVDPASYLLEHRLRKLEGATTFRLAHQPFELTPPPSPRPALRESETLRRWERMLEPGKEMGIQMKRPWIVPWSRKAHELASHAAAKGCFREIHDTLFRAYLVEGVDIGRVDVLVELAARHALDPKETKAALDIDLHGSSVMEARQAALDMGVREVPTLLWLGRRLEGYPDQANLARFLALEP